MKIVNYFKTQKMIILENNDKITLTDFPKDFCTEEKPLGYWKYIDDKLIFDNSEKMKCDQKNMNVQIRNIREIECFPIINRGKLWYDDNLNTDERRIEFNKWYSDWLNLPIIVDYEKPLEEQLPKKPEWLK